MSNEQRRILDLVAAGKITAEEGERLLAAMGETAERGPSAPSAPIPPEPPSAPGAMPKFLYVKIDAANKDKVNVKVPLGLLRAGLRLTSLIPPQAMDQINDSMSEHGMSIDFQNLKPEDIEDLVANLREMTVDIDAGNGDNVKVYCA